jgi:hypothetical protein
MPEAMAIQKTDPKVIADCLLTVRFLSFLHYDISCQSRVCRHSCCFQVWPTGSP